jgi:hypothetical protein
MRHPARLLFLLATFCIFAGCGSGPVHDNAALPEDAKNLGTVPPSALRPVKNPKPPMAERVGAGKTKAIGTAPPLSGQ